MSLVLNSIGCINLHYTVCIYFIPAVHVLTILLNYTDKAICNLTDLAHSRVLYAQIKQSYLDLWRSENYPHVSSVFSSVTKSA